MNRHILTEQSSSVGRVKISVPSVGFFFEATGPEEAVGDWAKKAIKAKFGEKAVETNRQRIERLVDESDRRNAGME